MGNDPTSPPLADASVSGIDGTRRQAGPCPAEGEVALMSVSVVVPVYNGRATLPELVARLEHVLGELGDAFEVILVNDGSRDESWSAICELAGRFRNVIGIDLLRNFGQHNALLAGIRAARYDVILTIDDDLQNPPEEIPKLLDELKKGWDVVYGVSLSPEHERWRTAASTVTKWILRAFMGAETAQAVSAFRAFRTQLREAFRDYRGSFVSIDVLLTWGTGRFGSAVVDHQPRGYGQSNYTFWKLATHAVNMLTGFSVVPLRMASWIGFAFTFCGVLVLAYVVGRYLWLGGSVPGFPFLASIVAIFAGAQLFALGIIGEYLARIHFRVMDKPSYTIRGEIRSSSSRERNGA
jgi:glycosyltransferase involved in cell wall biosynthesis